MNADGRMGAIEYCSCQTHHPVHFMLDTMATCALFVDIGLVSD